MKLLVFLYDRQARFAERCLSNWLLDKCHFFVLSIFVTMILKLPFRVRCVIGDWLQESSDTKSWRGCSEGVRLPSDCLWHFCFCKSWRRRCDFERSFGRKLCCEGGGSPFKPFINHCLFCVVFPFLAVMGGRTCSARAFKTVWFSLLGSPVLYGQHRAYLLQNKAALGRRVIESWSKVAELHIAHWNRWNWRQNNCRAWCDFWWRYKQNDADVVGNCFEDVSWQ